MDYQLRELSGLLGNFTDTCRSVLSYLSVDIFEAVLDSSEPVLNDHVEIFQRNAKYLLSLLIASVAVT